MTKSATADIEETKSEKSSGKRRLPNREIKPRSALHAWNPEANAKKAQFIEKKQHLFSCVTGSSKTKKSAEEEEETKSVDFKAEIVAQLSKLMDIYLASGDKGKAMGYRRAISNIKAFSQPITDANQMDQIPFVGDGIKRKVRELIAEGKMSKLTNLQSDKKLKTLEEFAQIWGVGP